MTRGLEVETGTTTVSEDKVNETELLKEVEKAFAREGPEKLRMALRLHFGVLLGMQEHLFLGKTPAPDMVHKWFVCMSESVAMLKAAQAALWRVSQTPTENNTDSME